MPSKPHTYSPIEEMLNVGSHGLGLLLSCVGTVFLILRANEYGSTGHLLSFLAFGGSLILLYTASTLYHSTSGRIARGRLRAFDHAAIYVLIAGTYTPFTLLVLDGVIGWTLFAITWSMALLGIILKIRFTGRYNRLSTAMYVLMGWLIVFAIKPLAANLSSEGIAWLAGGGISYTVGAIFYSIKRMPLGHATFHIFVLLGSICHFIVVYAYVVPK